MCIITTEELEAERQRWLKVTKTNIFARHTRPGYQAIVYSLSIASKSAAAMILPLPVVPGSGEDALAFIDLSGYAEFFDELAAACEPEVPDDSLEHFDDFDLGATTLSANLQVHEVGDFEASYVPAMADFIRLDPRFRLPDDVWQKMPPYDDYGFAVFQLKIVLADEAESTENTVHPMALEFPTRDEQRLFYPTVHVHDGDFHENAGFYHRFYAQRIDARAEFKHERDLLQGYDATLPQGVDEMLFDWYYRTLQPAHAVVAVERSEGIIDPEKIIHAMSLHGSYPNRDIWLG